VETSAGALRPVAPKATRPTSSVRRAPRVASSNPTIKPHGISGVARCNRSVLINIESQGREGLALRTNKRDDGQTSRGLNFSQTHNTVP